MPLKIRACPIKETVKNKIQKIQREQKEGKEDIKTNERRTGFLPEKNSYLKLPLFFIKHTKIAATDYQILTTRITQGGPQHSRQKRSKKADTARIRIISSHSNYSDCWSQ